jgi:ubiquinone/menaquinone biosynthesis C-methylase UbiE
MAEASMTREREQNSVVSVLNLHINYSSFGRSSCYLPFKDESFGVVKASHVLEHLRNPFKVLDEMLRVATKEQNLE